MGWWLHIQDSADGAPLVTRVQELVDFGHHFPYHRLPPIGAPVVDGTGGPGSSVHAVFTHVIRLCLRPEMVCAMVALYLVSEPLVVRSRRLFGLDEDKIAASGPPRWFTTFVALHNFLLFVFSAVVAVGSWTSVLTHYQQYGPYDAYCDPHKTLWNQHSLGHWSTLFYVSKYYEWIDTWILVLKKGTGGASFLQYFHHAGIVLAMYGGIASQSSWLSWVVLLNSVIHTFMYLYFFVKTLRPSLHIAAAKYLTQAQMLQFVTGIVGTLGVQFMGEACDTQSSRFALAFLQLYGVGLLFLFAAFHRRKYRPDGGRRSSSQVKSKAQ